MHISDFELLNIFRRILMELWALCPTGPHAQQGVMTNGRPAQRGPMPNRALCSTGRPTQRGPMPNRVPCPMGCHAQRGAMSNRALCPTGRHVQPRNHQQSEIIAHPKGAMPCQRDTALPMGALPSPNARYPAQPRTLTYKALWPATITLTLAPYSKPQCPKTRQVS